MAGSCFHLFGACGAEKQRRSAHQAFVSICFHLFGGCGAGRQLGSARRHLSPFVPFFPFVFHLFSFVSICSMAVSPGWQCRDSFRTRKPDRLQSSCRPLSCQGSISGRDFAHSVVSCARLKHVDQYLDKVEVCTIVSTMGGSAQRCVDVGSRVWSLGDALVAALLNGLGWLGSLCYQLLACR